MRITDNISHRNVSRTGLVPRLEGPLDFQQRGGRHDLRCQWDVPDAAFMVLPLDRARLTPGMVRYRDEFSTVT